MNFRGYIALPLENKAKNIMAKNGINGVTVSADAIEYGSFVSVMAFLLYVELGNSEEVLCFLRKSAKYLGSSAWRVFYPRISSPNQLQIDSFE